MSKRARIRREREAALQAENEEKVRGPISEKEARQRSHEWRKARIGRGSWWTTRTRRDVKQGSSFTDQAPKKRREKKRGRR